jgi:hypothetical protein
MSSSRRIFAVAILMLVLLLSQAIPSAAQAHGSASAHPTSFTTAAPANTGSQYQPVTEPNNVPSNNVPPTNVPQILVTPLTSYSDYYPGFGRGAGGSTHEVVQPETPVQERTEDRVQPQPKIGEE